MKLYERTRRYFGALLLVFIGTLNMGQQDLTGCVTPIVQDLLARMINESLNAKPVTVKKAPDSATPSPNVTIPENTPFLQFESLQTDRGNARVGETVTIVGVYTAVNGNQAPKGILTLSFDGKPFAPVSLELPQGDRQQFSKPLPIKQGLKKGAYTVDVRIEYCGQSKLMTCSYSVLE